MNGQERRNAIIERLKGSTSPISAKSLADEHSVTRQIIVAEGLSRHVAVKHGMEAIADEFYAVVDNGGKVLDISVEHSLYGSISAELNITSRYEADQFVKKAEETGATPLSLVTEGIHIHTIAVKDEEAFSRIVARLSELGILVETN